MDSVEALLIHNDESLEQFIVRNKDVDKSKFNYSRFINRTIWGQNNFPMHKGFLKRKKQRKTEKRKKIREREQREMEDLVEANIANLPLNDEE